MNHNNQQFPEWIPWQGTYIHGVIEDNGGYADQRLKGAVETLFHDESLNTLWELFSKLNLAPDGWSFLIGGIIQAVECAPTKGKRATRKRDDDEKIRILKQQQKVDKKLAAISKKASELAKLLNDLEANGGKVPAETYSGLALIERSIENNSIASASCSPQFKAFQRTLSSYDKARFPKPEEVICQLAMAIQEHPDYKNIFADTPWLSSGHSSWKDYVRVLKKSFEDCHWIYGDAPSLSDSHWHLLVKAMVDKTISRQTVTKGLKEL